MKILVINQLGQSKKIETPVLPRVGDRVDLFYRPHPVVQDVLLWPSKETYGLPDDIIAVVTVS